MDDISKGLDLKVKKGEKMTEEERRKAFFEKM